MENIPKWHYRRAAFSIRVCVLSKSNLMNSLFFFFFFVVVVVVVVVVVKNRKDGKTLCCGSVPPFLPLFFKITEMDSASPDLED